MNKIPNKTKLLLKKLKKVFKSGRYFLVFTEINDMIRFGKLAEGATLKATSVAHIDIHLEISFGWWYMQDANKVEVYKINRPSFGFHSRHYSENPDDENYTLIKEISKEDFFYFYKKVEQALSIKKEIDNFLEKEATDE